MFHKQYIEFGYTFHYLFTYLDIIQLRLYICHAPPTKTKDVFMIYVWQQFQDAKVHIIIVKAKA